MAARIPLIINSSAQQIQELPVGDNLLVDGLITTGGFTSGIITATKFVGDGSGLTNLAGIGTASGIEIREEGTAVGTATTINFIGAGVTATISGGIASVEITSSGGGGGGGLSNVVEDTTPQLGGNLDLNSKDITGTGDIDITGTITATSFSGPLTGAVTGNVTGAASQVTVADESSDTACNVLFTTAATGNLPPKSGSNLTFNSANGTLTATTFVGGGALQSRTVVTGSTSSIINNATDNVNLTGFKSYALMKVGLSANAWIRLYTDSTSRTNDASRSVGEDPLPGSGVIAEVVGSSNQLITPFVMGGNMDGSPSTTIYAAITNLSGSTQSITANLTILQLEQ
tara:strand:- start:814 stop:1845 length:1032 start_codon:yes stop_codon:yes gene_type:complete